MICNPYPSDPHLNRNPLNWNPLCTKNKCSKCNGDEWLSELKDLLVERKLEGKIVTYSQWVSEEADKTGTLEQKNTDTTEDSEQKKKQKKQILRQEKCTIIEFLNDICHNALIKSKFPEHLRKAWCQWQITKMPIKVISVSTNDVAIRTREDFQEDIKFLCTSQTVSTHRGVGVITMVCYPVVIEIFRTDDSKEMHGLILMSDTKSKNFDTVRYFEEKCIQYVQKKGYQVVRYDRITDGCSSQFWCYGSYTHLDSMPDDLQIPLINFHRYERYEGKNLSDALGSLLKRRMRSGALENKIVGSR